MIELKSVSFSYRKGSRALDNVSLVIEEGLFWGVIGPNGSGKTTLLDIMAGYRIPAAGSVKYKGKDLSDYTKRDLAKSMAFVPQEQGISFPFKVEEVILMGRYPYMSRLLPPSQEDMKASEDAMNILKLSHLRDRYITELSGGEKQRVFVARALCQDTPVLLLDEAISQMDIKYSLLVLEVLKRKVREQKKTVVFVMHDLNLAFLYCDGLIIMKQGSIVRCGKKEEVVSEGLLKDVFEVDCHLYKEEAYGTEQILFRLPSDYLYHAQS